MNRFRTLVFWTHLATGAVAGAVVLIMSVTGVLLTYQRQITAWADTRGLDGAPPAAGAAQLSAERLLERVGAATDGEPTAVRWHADPDRPAEVVFGRQKTVFASAYTGEVLGEGSARVRGFFRTVTDWHRWLAASGDARDRGRAVTGAANLGFLFLVASGFWLWWPRSWRPGALRNVTLFRRGLSGKARDFNWHNVIGFWSLVPLFVVVVSAVVISYPWASDLVYRLAGDTPGAPGGGGGPRGADAPAEPAAPSLAGVDAFRADAVSRFPGWRTVTMSVPEDAGEPVAFTVDRGDGGQPQKRANVAYDPATGAVARLETFADGSSGRRARSILRFAHTGEVLGFWGQTVAGLVSLGAAVLVWTGIALSLRRLRAWLGRRRRPTPSLAGAAEPDAAPRRRRPAGAR